MAEPLAISPYGIEFLKRQEGFRPHAYGDFKQTSIGYGTRARYPGETIDKTEAQRRLIDEAGKVAQWLRTNVTAPLSQNQTDGLISAGYNLGTGPTGLGRLLGDINSGNWASVAARLPTFNKAGGEVNGGLVSRRAAEVNLLTGKDTANMTPGEMLLKRAIQRNSAPIGTPAPSAAPTPVAPAGMEQLKAALGGSYDPDRLSRYDTMMKQGQQIAGSSGNALGAIGGSLVAALGAGIAGTEGDRKKAFDEQLRQGLTSAANTAAVAKLLVASPDPKQQELGIGLMAKAEAAAKTAQESFGKTPVWGVDANGNPALVQVSDRGRGVQTALPQGVKVGKDPIKMDAGTHWVLLDPVTRQPIGQIPKDVAGEEQQKAEGKGAGERVIAQPATNASLRSSLAGLDRLAESAQKLKALPGLPSATGNVQGRSFVPTLRQSTADAEAEMDTLKSQVAFSVLQSMRDASKTGGALGSIAVEELKMLQNNLASLDPLQGDEKFKQSLDEIARYAEGAKERLRRGYRDTYGAEFKDTAGPAAAPAADQPAAPAGGYKVLKVH